MQIRRAMKTLLLLALAAAAHAAAGNAFSDDAVCSVDAAGNSACADADGFFDVRPDQPLPAGVHVRIDWQTGRRQAKLLDVADSPASELVAVPSDEEPAAPVRIHHGHPLSQNDDAAVKTTHAKSSITIEESQAFEHIVDALASANRSVVAPALNALEDIVGQIDFGIALAQNNVAIPMLLSIAAGNAPEPSESADESDLAAHAALVLGTAMSNNPEAQTTAADRFELPLKLWNLVEICVTQTPPNPSAEDDRSLVLQNRLVYAFAASIRSNAEAARPFVKPSLTATNSTIHADNSNDDATISSTIDATNTNLHAKIVPGLSRMATVFESSRATNRTRRRLLDLFADIVDPHMHPNAESTDSDSLSSSSLDLLGIDSWCQICTNIVARNVRYDENDIDATELENHASLALQTLTSRGFCSKTTRATNNR